MKNKQEKTKIVGKTTKGLRKEKAALRTIFIGGIPLQSKPKEIASYLATYDVVESLRLPKDNSTGKIKGFAKAVLGSVQGMERLLSETNHFIGGLKVGISQWKDTSDYIQEKRDESEKKIYIKYPPGLSTTLLLDYLLSFGEILNVDHKRNPVTNKQRYFCYVTFESVEAAQLIIRQKEHWIAGYLVIAELSKPQHIDIDSIEQKAPQTSSLEGKDDESSFRKGPKQSSIDFVSNDQKKFIAGRCTHDNYPSQLKDFSRNIEIDKPAQKAVHFESSSQKKRWLEPKGINEGTNQLFANRIEEQAAPSLHELLNNHLHGVGSRWLTPDSISNIHANHRTASNLRFNFSLLTVRY